MTLPFFMYRIVILSERSESKDLPRNLNCGTIDPSTRCARSG